MIKLSRKQLNVLFYHPNYTRACLQMRLIPIVYQAQEFYSKVGLIRLISIVAYCDCTSIRAGPLIVGRSYNILVVCIKLNYAMQRVVILNIEWARSSAR
jgi:hypothetical protein